MGLFQKVTIHKLCQNANFENGGITIKISLLPRVHDTSVNFEIKKRVVMSFYVFEEN